ncbi:FtsX-like permease family protein [Trueperella pyogenes]|uniref:FtsX-like permease family protein n=1 Tax=Trueperella pyogenes TaxID=1661 RepID=UPI00345DDB65
MEDDVSLSRLSILRSLFDRNRWGFLLTSILSLLLNSVIWNAVLGARHSRVISGDFQKAANINALLEVTFQFNLIFAVIAAAISAMLLVSALSARYSSRKDTVRILRLAGLSFSDLLVSHVVESLVFGIVATFAALLMFFPAVWVYGQMLRTAGLVPKEITIHANLMSSLLVCVAMIAFIVGTTVAKTVSVHGTKEQSVQDRRNHKIKFLVGIIVAVALGIPLVIPNSPIPTDTRMVLIIPWACLILLVYGVRILREICISLQRPLRKTGRFPRLGLALARLAQSMSSRMNPVIPLTIVMAFMVPLSAVMATGRSVSIVEIYSSVHAQSIATTTSLKNVEELASTSKTVSRTLLVGTSNDLYRTEDPYGATQPTVGLFNLHKTSNIFPSFKVRAGSIDSLDATHVATSNSGLNVGDELSFYMADGRQCTLTIAATLSAPSLLKFDVIGMAENPPCGGMSVRKTTAYSLLGIYGLEEQLGNTEWDIVTIDEWIKTGILQTERNQRSALIIMFLIPMVMALFVTGTSIGAYREMIRRSSVVLFSVGGSSKDFRIISLYEMIIGCVASLLLLGFAIGLSMSIVVPFAQESGIGLSLDRIVAGGFLMVTLSIIAIIYLVGGEYSLRTARRWRNGKTS